MYRPAHVPLLVVRVEYTLPTYGVNGVFQAMYRPTPGRVPHLDGLVPASGGQDVPFISQHKINFFNILNSEM